MSLKGSATYQLTMRNVKVALRNKPAIAFSVVQPVLWMTLFSQNFKRVVDFPAFRELGYTSYLAFFVPGIMVLTVLNASALSGISMISDINAGVMDRYLINPIRRSSILLGRVLADAIRMTLQCLIVLGIAFAMGAKSQTGIGGVAVVLVLTLLLGICSAAFSDFIALSTRNAQLTMLVSGIIALPLLLLSPAFFPQQLQAGWLRAVEKINPAAYVITSGQNLMNLGVRWGQLLAAVGVVALTGLLCFGGTIRAFRRVTNGASGDSVRMRIFAHRRRLRAALPDLPEPLKEPVS